MEIKCLKRWKIFIEDLDLLHKKSNKKKTGKRKTNLGH